MRVHISEVSEMATDCYIHYLTNIIINTQFVAAIMHAGPIPWDDDSDLIMEHEKMEQFIDACNDFEPVPGIRIKCVVHWNAVKMFAFPTEDDGISYEHPKNLRGYFDYARDVSQFKSPYIDVALFREDDDFVYELSPFKVESGVKIQKSLFYPARDYYFAGLTMPGPNISAASDRYDLTKCYTTRYNHRLEAHFISESRSSQEDLQMNCCELEAAGYPFVNFTLTGENENRTRGKKHK